MQDTLKTALVIIILAFTGCLFLSFQPAFADALETGQAVEYTSYISQFELSTDGGSTWTTIFSGTSTGVNMGSSRVSRGQSAGNFLSNLSVPDGTYNRVKVTPSGTFVIKGAITYSNQTYYTTAQSRSGGGSIASTDANNYAECTIAISGCTAQEYDASATPIVVTDGVATRKVRVSFNVENGVGLYAAPPGETHQYEIYPQIPVVTMSLQ